MPTNADGLEIIEPPQRNADGFEIIPAPKIDTSRFGQDSGVHLNADGFPILEPSQGEAFRQALEPKAKLNIPSEISLEDMMSAVHPSPAREPIANALKQAGYPTREPGSLEPEDQDWWDKFTQSELGRKLVGQGDSAGPAASDIERQGVVGSFGSLPARVTGLAGKAAQAGLGDMAAAIDAKADQPTGANEFGGNVKALLQHEQQLPVQRGIELSKAEDREKGELGWQTLAADISLGLADLAPKIVALEAAPSGLAQPVGGAALFGFNDKGEFSASGAAGGALLPFVSKATADVVDQAVKSAVNRGFTWAGKPQAQAAIHVAANQAAMDTVMALQQSPQLLQLQANDPEEFKREVAKMLGSNLAFAIPEALRERETVQPVTKDLAAELQAAMQGNQVAPSRQPLSRQPLSNQPASEAVTDNLVGEAVRRITGQIPGARVTVEAPAESQPTVGAEPMAEPGPAPADVQNVPQTAIERELTQQQPQQQARPRFKSLADTGGEIGLPREAPQQDFEPAKSAEQYTILDAIKENGRLGGPNIQDALAEMDEGRRAADIAGRYGGGYDALADVLEQIHVAKGAERKKLIKAYELAGFGGNRGGVDETLASMIEAQRMGLGFSGVPTNEYDLINDAFDAAKAKVSGAAILPKDAEGKADLFWKTATNPESKIGLLRVDVGTLQVGQKFRLRGKGLSHEELEVIDKERDPNSPDEDPRWIIRVKDGTAFGEQDLPEGTEIYVQKPAAGEPGVTREQVKESKARRSKRILERMGGEGESEGEALHETGTPYRVREREHPGDPGLWHLPDEEVQRLIDEHVEQNDQSEAARYKLEGLEREAKARGLIDKTTAETQADERARAKAEAEAERERKLDEQDSEISRREQHRDDSGRDADHPGGQQRKRRGNDSRRTAGSLRPAASPRDEARLEWIRSEIVREKKLVARGSTGREVYNQPYPDDIYSLGAYAGIHYLEGQMDVITTPPEQRSSLDILEAERAEAMHELNTYSREYPSRRPESYLGVKTLARIRYLEGQIDEQLRIADEEAARKAPGQMDFEQWLDRAIDSTDPLKGGQMMEGVTGAPVWLTKTLANGALRVLRATYRAGKNLKIAINEALQWLHEQKVKGFDAGEAREWLVSEIERHHGDVERATAESFADLNEPQPEKVANRKPTPPEIPPGTGRSLDALTDWLKENKIDSPKRSLRDRLDLAGKLAARWQEVRDSFDAARTKLAAAWRTGLESVKHPPIDTGFRNALKDWIFYDTWTGAETGHWISELKRKVESPLRRMGMSIWLDAGGDEATLKRQLAAVPERFRPVWEKALELTPTEKQLATKIKADFEQKLADAKTAGLIEKGRKDYGVPQLWSKEPEPPFELSDQGFATKEGPPGNWRAKLDPRDPFFAFQRLHPTYFEGIMHGGIPKGLDVAELVGVYNEAFHKSLSSRGAIWALKNQAAKDGLPIVKIAGGGRLATDQEPGTYFIDAHARKESDVSEDGRPYRPIDHFALRDWKVAHKTEDGKLIFVRGDMLVHPDHYDFLKNELMRSPLREGRAGAVLNPVFRSSFFLKSSKLALGTFHLATVGEHALFHLVNPVVKGFDIDLRNADQALLVRNGLELGLSGPQSSFEEGLASHGGIFEKIPGLGDFSRKFSDFLFKDYIPRLSMKTALTVLERNRARYSDKLSESQIAELTAHQMNAAFGMQNYRLLGRDKTLLDINRMLFLAPQFLFSRAKVVGQALKPYGAEQRRMLFLQAATLYVGSRLLNAWLDHDPHWEPKMAFAVAYKGRAYSMRFIVGDMWHMLTDLKSFAAGRLAPLLKIGIETITQRDLRTGARKEPPIQTEWMPSRVAQNLVVDLAKWLLPVGTEGLLPGAAGREQGPIDTALASAGVGSHKYTAATQVAEWARDFNRQGDAHARSHQRQLDAEPHGEGTYRKLDALLDAGKFDQAATEYRALIQDGHADKSIVAHYEKSQPLTGNKAREQLFLQSLNERQKAMYDRALTERKQREQAFRAMLDRESATARRAY